MEHGGEERRGPPLRREFGHHVRTGPTLREERRELRVEFRFVEARLGVE